MRILEIESWPRERKLGFQVKLGLQLNPPPLRNGIGAVAALCTFDSNWT